MLRIANAPCSWGILEFDLDPDSIKTAAYDEVLDEMRAAGYGGTELGDWGFLPTDPEALRTALGSRSLDLVGAFVPVAFSVESAYRLGEDLALRTANLLADSGYNEALLILADDNGSDPTRTRNAGRITSEMGLQPAQWDVFARRVNRAAQRITAMTGLRVAFHHHCAGFVETVEEIEILLSLTDPELLGLVLDTGHLTYGGGDPVQVLREHSARIRHVHFKDCSRQIALQARLRGWSYFEALEAGLFCELGSGCVDFGTIVLELQRQRYNGWVVVEQDVLPGMGTPADCARHNLRYLQSLPAWDTL